MANTPNLDLVKPAGTDQALISVINSNSDKIDAGFGSLSDQMSTDYTPTGTYASGIRANRNGRIAVIHVSIVTSGAVSSGTVIASGLPKTRYSATLYARSVEGNLFSVDANGDLKARENLSSGVYANFTMSYICELT